MKKSLLAGSQVLLCILSAALCTILLVYSDTVREGVKAGLETSAQVIIPSLYLFMALSGTIAHSRAGGLLSRPLAPLTRRILKLPACMGPAILLSAIGGYPVGAKTIAILLEQKRITREDAQRAICFCCNAGPSFAVTAVGSGMLGSTRAGAILLLAHLAASLLTGMLLSRRLPVPPKQPQAAQGLPPGEAFILGVNGATSGILTICAYVVIFSAAGALLEKSGFATILSQWLPGAGEALSALLLGLLEVTTGCLAAACLPGRLPLILIPFFISFAGLSIFFQIRAILQPYRLHFGPFLSCRVLHGALTVLLGYPLLRLSCRSVAAFGSAAVPVAYHTPNTPAGTLLLLGVSAMALWSLEPLSKTKKREIGRKTGEKEKKPVVIFHRFW